ncbi:hypothetical protein [Mariniblastus fucicola]|uniref:hypothetical protein n=1 Tax=Mariniblastus fucicola TaxID=980251 RepID=UPI0011DF0E1B|nr:hypothetical protein [Mariniblastus fucicola]
MKLWIFSLLLAFATSFGPAVTLSIAESLSSEESNVELTELVEFEVDGEEKIVESRQRRIFRRSIVCRRSDTGQLHKPSKSEVADVPPSARSRHKGCGSHLRI